MLQLGYSHPISNVAGNTNLQHWMCKTGRLILEPSIQDLK